MGLQLPHCHQWMRWEPCNVSLHSDSYFVFFIFLFSLCMTFLLHKSQTTAIFRFITAYLTLYKVVNCHYILLQISCVFPSLLAFNFATEMTIVNYLTIILLLLDERQWLL
jgi:hypothetical protein